MTEQGLKGIPHSSSRDDVYKGFFIPKGQIPLTVIVHYTLTLTTRFKRLYNGG